MAGGCSNTERSAVVPRQRRMQQKFSPSQVFTVDPQFSAAATMQRNRTMPLRN
jgi:hypothetical protein